MSITATQKIIKVGTSGMVTVPAKGMREMGISYGDEVKVTFEPVNHIDPHTVEIVEITQKLIKRHKQALKNLSQR